MRLMTEGEDYPLATFPDYEKKDLRALALSIEHENGMMEIASLTVVHHAVRCGKALHAAKSKVPHGSWMQWIEDNTTLPHSTANMFMTLASNSQRVENSESIRGALKLLADDRAEERRSKQIKYVPYDGEEIVTKKSSHPPANIDAEIVTTSRPPVTPATIEAEVVEPASSITSEDEPDPLVVDETSDTKNQPATRLPKWKSDDADRLWLLARIHLDKILRCDVSRLKVAKLVIEYGEKLGSKKGGHP